MAIPQQEKGDRACIVRQSCADVLRTDSFGDIDLVALCERRLAAITAKAG